MLFCDFTHAPLMLKRAVLITFFFFFFFWQQWLSLLVKSSWPNSSLYLTLLNSIYRKTATHIVSLLYKWALDVWTLMYTVVLWPGSFILAKKQGSRPDNWVALCRCSNKIRFAMVWWPKMVTKSVSCTLLPKKRRINVSLKWQTVGRI